MGCQPRGRRRRQGLDADRLEWVHRNRQPRDRTERLGEVTRRLDLEATGRNSVARRVYAAIDAVVDGRFRRVCRFGEARAGEVVILVTDPDSLYHIRMEWLSVLRERIGQMCPRQAAWRLRFKTGEGGVGFSPSGD